ncbi:hypothetical protein ACVWWG_006439 [Bradyrhizobium sp. LB7.2]|jgi:hypothetical protein
MPAQNRCLANKIIEFFPDPARIMAFVCLAKRDVHAVQRSFFVLGLALRALGFLLPFGPLEPFESECDILDNAFEERAYFVRDRVGCCEAEKKNANASRALDNRDRQG